VGRLQPASALQGGKESKALRGLFFHVSTLLGVNLESFTLNFQEFPLDSQVDINKLERMWLNLDHESFRNEEK
jgi:hypothetical protein